ncbi:MAG: glutamine-hydrolyzing carbamoyl-phosphate synthase small subunit [Chthonomonadales bacterium]|nr:glutamine-hydrolyzing carbamoyl-phosphate synthase small subunit [Chthonomonadales bacterium]
MPVSGERPAMLLLEDGTVFRGVSLGHRGLACGEVVFNTGMTGYQETLTDPSYAGQIVTLTYPLIGNYGFNHEDFESRRLQVEGFVVRESSEEPSNWRSAGTLDGFLRDHRVVGIQGVDTRALTRRLRAHGSMMGVLSCDESLEAATQRLRSAPPYDKVDFVKKVSADAPYEWPAEGEPRVRIALLDCGVKFSILRHLAKRGCATTVWPCTASAHEILERQPDGIFLSPGPGDPSNLGHIVDTVRQLAYAKPTIGVCLGNQLLGFAFGGRCFKLRFGHRGSNHPARDLETGRVYITSQNHGYALDPASLQDGMEVAHVNVNDGTVEGLRHRELPILSIQYHPEASPGPHDSGYFFDRFIGMLEAV